MTEHNTHFFSAFVRQSQRDARIIGDNLLLGFLELDPIAPVTV